MTKITLLILSLHLMLAQGAHAQAKQGAKKGDLESNLSVLNLFEKQPESTIQMYRLAYRTLSTRRDATFQRLAENDDFQSLCRKPNTRYTYRVSVNGNVIHKLTLKRSQLTPKTAKE